MSFRRFIAALALFCMTGTATADIYTQTQSGAVAFPNSDPVVLTFTGTPEPITDAVLTLVATGGELNLANKRLEQLNVEGTTYQTPGQPAGWILPTNQLDGSGSFPDPVTIPLAEFANFTNDGQVIVSVVRPGFISGGTFDLTLSYEFAAIPEPGSGALLVSVFCMLARVRRR